MAELRDGESKEMPGSGARPYVLKYVGGVYSCSCPGWRNQSLPIERRTCKHLRRLRGDAAEDSRVGAPTTSTEVAAATQTPPPILLAEKWPSDYDPAGWHMCEKLDGVRAYWTGEYFLSRLGNRYHAPAWFTVGLPKFPLDGELWMNRKQFQRTVSIVRRQDEPDSWRHVRFVIFDSPATGGAFEDRLQAITALFDHHGPNYAWPHPHVRCRDRDHLRQMLSRIEDMGGEGVMLRKPGSDYEVGRSPTLLKVERFHDAEARVVGHEPGRGRHRGQTGALLVELEDGTRFAVGSGLTEAQRRTPPAIGSLITFRFQELTDAGVPRFPIFVRMAE